MKNLITCMILTFCLSCQASASEIEGTVIQYIGHDIYVVGIHSRLSTVVV